MVKLTKALIKKYGVSKKAWVVARRQQGGKTRKARTTTKRKIKRQTMARRKTTKRASPKRDIFSYIKNPVVGSIGVVGYEAFLSPMLNNALGGNQMVQDVVELMAGAYLSKKQGIMGATGKALVTLNSYQLVSGLANNIKSGGIGNIFKSQTTPSTGYAF